MTSKKKHDTNEICDPDTSEECRFCKYSRMILPVALIFLSAAILQSCSHYKEAQISSVSADRKFRTKIIRQIKLIERKEGCRIGLAFKDKDLPLSVEYRGDERFHAASTMKVPVMIEVFRQAEKGVFSLDDKMLVDPECQSFLEDSTFICDARGHINDMLNKEETVRKVTEQMIVVSDNLATNLLIAKCGYRQMSSGVSRMNLLIRQAFPIE